MKKFYLLTKTLLIAALLMVGASNAWGTVTPFSESYSSTSTTTGWSTATSGRYTPVILNESDNYFLSVNQTQRYNNGTTVTGNILSEKAAAGDDFTLMFDFRISTSSDQNPVEFNIYDAANSEKIFSLVNTGKNSAEWKINGSSTQKVTLAGTGSTDNNNPSTSTIGNYSWFSAKVSRKGAVTYLTITKTSDASVVFARDVVASPSSTGGLGNIKFVTKRYNSNFAIDNIVVREIEEGDVPDITYYSATFTETNSLKPTVKIYSNAARTSEVTNGALTDETTYYYRAILEAYNNYEGSFTVDGADPSVSFTMTAKTRYTFKACAVNSVGGAILETFYTDEDSYEGKKHNIEYPKYLTGTGNIVTYSKDNNTYGESVTASAANETHEVSYTAYDGVAYFVEVEDVVSPNHVSNWNYSNGTAVRGFTTAKSIFTVPATGTYDITYAACNYNVNYDLTFVLSKNDSEIATSANLKSVSVNSIKTSGIVTNNNVSLASGDVLKLTPSSTNGIVDYMLIELKSVPVTVTAAGYATFSSAYDLDFTTPITGLTAYKAASATESTITLEKVTGKVKAGNGLVIKGDAGTYSIPVTTGASTIYDTPETINMWGYNGNETETVSEAGSGTNFVLSVQDEEVVFAPIKSENATLNPGQAALWASVDIATLEARGMSLVIADEVITGISEAAATTEAVQKEGKFVVDGKLVIFKKGMKFNANGQRIY